MRRGFTLIELMVVITIIGILAAIALPNYVRIKEKAKEAECKANLHNIQLAVEQFAVDNEGFYPRWIIGGEPRYAAMVDTAVYQGAFTQITECEPQEGLSDPLLRAGYLDSYPRNPFIRNGSVLHRVQADLPSSYTGDDPLRNGPDGDASQEGLGTRFGPYCTTVGNILADPRFPAWRYLGNRRDTWADIQYNMWDLWIGNRHGTILPGQFFYKSAGPYSGSGDTSGQGTEISVPHQITQYMLGSYGGTRTKGLDVLGQERPIRMQMFGHRGSWLADAAAATTGLPQAGVLLAMQIPIQPPSSGSGNTVNELWPWTRSEVTSSPPNSSTGAGLNGSPYKTTKEMSEEYQLDYGNPNAIRDAVIMVLINGGGGMGK